MINIAEYTLLQAGGGPSALVEGPDGRMYGTCEPIGFNSVVAVTTSGVVTSWSIPTGNSGPGGLAFDNQSPQLCWFTENRANQIASFDPNVGTITEYAWGVASAGLGGICRRTDNLMWVASTTNNKMTPWNPATQTAGTAVTVGSFPHDPLIFSDTKCYFCLFNGDQIGRVDNSGTYTSWNLTIGSKPYALCQGPDGLVYATCENGNQIVQLNQSTGTANYFTVPDAAAAPRGICVGPDGNIWFTGKSSNKIYAITTSLVLVGSWVIPTGNSQPIKLLPGSDGRLWFAEQNANNFGAVGKINMAGNINSNSGSNNQSITVTLNSLANNGQRASGAIDNTTNRYMDALVSVKWKNGTSGNGQVNVYAYGSTDNGASYPEGVTGSDAGVTLTSPPNLRLIGVIQAPASATSYQGEPMSVAAAFGGPGNLPDKWGIVVENKTGQTSDATAGNFAVNYQGMYAQYT